MPTVQESSGVDVIYSDASNKGLGCVLLPHRKIIVYTSCQLVAMVFLGHVLSKDEV